MFRMVALLLFIKYKRVKPALQGRDESERQTREGLALSEVRQEFGIMLVSLNPSEKTLKTTVRAKRLN
jgi:hypothetical protein